MCDVGSRCHLSIRRRAAQPPVQPSSFAAQFTLQILGILQVFLESRQHVFRIIAHVGVLCASRFMSELINSFLMVRHHQVHEFLVEGAPDSACSFFTASVRSSGSPIGCGIPFFCIKSTSFLSASLWSLTSIFP